MRKKQLYIIISIMSLLLIGAVTYIIVNHSGGDISPPLEPDSNAVQWQGEQQINQLPNGQKGIAIPGFESLTFIANQTEQKVNFYNPENNDCLFLMTLYENDSCIWESGYVTPGKGFYHIELTNQLKAGDYSGNLKIQCFRNDGTALNSANVEFKLIVQEANQ